MDPITHGIAGSLLGKSLFTKREGRIATFACTLGAVFPDVDIFAELFSRDPLSVINSIADSPTHLPAFRFSP